MTLVLGVPPAILDLNQRGLLERAFHDGLYPAIAYRAEFMREDWPANTGEEIIMSRPGLLPPVVTPIAPGADPLPQSPIYEQWSATLAQYTASIDTDIPTSATSNANLFLRNIHQSGLQAGQSINRIARNQLFKSYLSGQTVTTAALLTGDTTIPVAALNGFRDVVITTLSARPQPVSASYPLPITVRTGSTTVTASVVGVIPNTPTDPDGPGLLVLSAALGSSAFSAARASVYSLYAPTVVRASGGYSVDAVTAGDVFVLQMAINAVSVLRTNNVQPHEDGFYHAHLPPAANAQVFADPVFQRLNQSLPDGIMYKAGFIGTLSGVMFFMNTESPATATVNASSLVSTSGSGVYSSEIGAEVTNGSGVNIGRILITGKGVGYERWMNEQKNYVTEAGTTGKIGEYTVVNNGIEVMTEGIRLILRAPLDRLQQKVAVTWSISTAFAIPSDITAPTGNQRFKRGLVLEFAIG